MKNNKEFIKNTLLSFTAVLFAFLLSEIALRVYFYHRHGPFPLAICSIQNRVISLLKPGRSDLNKMAWEASFLERGLQVPPDGPREGPWGQSVIKGDKNCGFLRYCLKTVNKPGMVEIDKDAFQYTAPVANPKIRILIIGASVARGAFASSASKVYFETLSQKLQAAGLPAEIVIFATDGWISSDKTAAFADPRIKRVNPELVIFIGGLNDVTIRPATSDGVKSYLRDMAVIGELGRLKGVHVLYVLQPTLYHKRQKSVTEQTLVRESLFDSEVIIQDYALMATGLDQIATQKKMSFWNASGVFDSEQATIFADEWHFSDPGQSIFAEGLSKKILELSLSKKKL